MSIKIYNTLHRKKEPFKPLEPGHIKIYVCGITSYDYCHIGHARSALVFDMIVSYFRYRGYKVTYVRNFTDVDDKIIARAAEQHVSPHQLAETFIDEFYVDMDRLGIARPTVEPKATENIDEMIVLINTLIEKGAAYPSAGDVYFSVSAFQEYGRLSGRNTEDMLAGARISVNEQKKDPMDFVLWKKAKPGEPSWDSPWGAGRPGWHIECSAMSKKYLGDTFDIHGGGQDLIFPHHENERAQSEGANDKKYAATWIHHGFVTIKDEKMSKSLGNFLRIRDILKKYHPEELRFFVFSTQYRNPLDFSESAMQDAITGLDRLYECMARIENLDNGSPDGDAFLPAEDRKKLAELEKRFTTAMDNDFNTAQAQGVLFDTAKLLNKICRMLPESPAAKDVAFVKQTAETFIRLADIMGILRENPAEYLARKKAKMLEGLAIDEQTINDLIRERLQARAEKDWARSDAIRDELLEKNIELQDNADGTSWTVKRSA